MYLSLELLLGGIGAGSTIGGILLWIIKRIWWDKRKWYRDMYDLVDKMVPFSPVIIKGINEDFGSKSDIYSEEYSTVMDMFLVKSMKNIETSLPEIVLMKISSIAFVRKATQLNAN